MIINMKIDDMTVSPQSSGMDRKGVPEGVNENGPGGFERLLAKNESNKESAEQKSAPDVKKKSSSDTPEELGACGQGLQQIGPALYQPLPQSQIQTQDKMLNPEIMEEIPLELPVVEKKPVDEMNLAVALGIPQLQMLNPIPSAGAELVKEKAAQKAPLSLESLAKEVLNTQAQTALQKDPKAIIQNTPTINQAVMNPSAEVKAPSSQGKAAESDNKPKSLEEIFFAAPAESNASERAIPESSSKSQMDLGSEDKSETLKDFASSLFVQNQLKGGSEVNFASQLSRQITVSEKPNPDVVRSNLFQDMKVHLEKMVAADRGGEVRIHMSPGDLGDVKIDVKVTGDAVRIGMTAEKSSAEGLLKNQAGELRNQLQNAGFKIEELQISSSRSAQQDRHFSQSERGFSGQSQEQQKRQPEAEPESNFEDQFIGAA